MTADDLTTYVTVEAAGQLFGVPIGRVREVFALEGLTRVPLAPPEVAGVLNLRGRIVTAIDMGVRLGLPRQAINDGAMALGVDVQGEAFALIVDAVGDVLALSDAEPTPATLDPRWAKIANGVHRLDGRLLVVLDIDRVLESGATAIAA